MRSRSLRTTCNCWLRQGGSKWPPYLSLRPSGGAGEAMGKSVFGRFALFSLLRGVYLLLFGPGENIFPMEIVGIKSQGTKDK